MRVAIGIDLAKIGEPLSARGEKHEQPLELALARVRHAGHAAGIAAVEPLGLGGDHIVDAELGGDRLGQKAEHRRRDDA